MEVGEAVVISLAEEIAEFLGVSIEKTTEHIESDYGGI
jgi:hypothetical protein